MKVSLAVAIGFAGCLLASFAQAGFAIHGNALTSTENGIMGDRAPETVQGTGAFKASTADLFARQRRLEGAELMVDLAYRSVTQRGSGEASVVEGFADDVPFTSAFSMILPDGWQLYKAENLESRKVPDNITFAGGVTWPEVLGQLGDRYALQFNIDWYDRVVLMKPGKPGILAAVDRIRVIEEPALPIEPAAVDEQQNDSAEGDESGEPDVAEAIPQPDPEPIIEELPTHNMLVLKGTLYQNVQRLSELNGWNPPQWSIEADYRINADYTIKADTFPEAMAKLLMLHPVEADVNVSERKVYVIKEIH